MTAAILDIRRTLESGVGLYAGGITSSVPLPAREPRELHRRADCQFLWRVGHGSIPE